MPNSDSIDISVLHQIIHSLVSVKEDIVIDRKVDEMGVLISVKVNPSDMGVLIGRNGIMADSIKTLMRAIGRAHDMNVRVKFLEPESSTHVQTNVSEVTTTTTQENLDTPSGINIDEELSEFAAVQK